MLSFANSGGGVRREKENRIGLLKGDDNTGIHGWNWFQRYRTIQFSPPCTSSLRILQSPDTLSGLILSSIFPEKDFLDTEGSHPSQIWRE
jgi:hypothetical protein